MCWLHVRLPLFLRRSVFSAVGVSLPALVTVYSSILSLFFESFYFRVILNTRPCLRSSGFSLEKLEDSKSGAT